MSANSPELRRRPKDRKGQILRVAARAFSERGYHPVGVDEIAAEVGISGPALYRHFANKYALFVAAAESSAQTLVDAARAGDDPTRPPDLRLAAIVDALVAITIENRRVGALYRWERRYLEPADRNRIREVYDQLNEVVAEPLRQLRPDLADADVVMLAAAALSTIGSISGHRTNLPTSRMQQLLADLCHAVLRTRLSPAPTEPASCTGPPGLAVTAKQERVLVEAIRVFGQRGYYDASMEEIGEAAGVNASSVYRYYPSKSALLAAAFYRSNDRVRQVITDALAESGSPAEAAANIAARYAALTFAHPHLVSVYFAEFGNLPTPQQDELRSLQRQNVGEWVHLLEQLRPADPAGARIRVHAALGLVVDIGRLVHFDTRPAQLRRVTELMTTLLFAASPDEPTTREGDRT
ncbi:TetR/AcrR family transcriptional regulator [Skermania piniformis]|uniref:TetR/AcrR family transcriptional regulator n=1 Tax=Skermania pinensis TaxID=39122 RepID=A0ABX8S9K7_9ACTN|nr:TetR/AcrR family transcriptional regulator [Skermania piniformis]QXQ14543.1 TetR/AcrR family transcriptional regulator [Skermania piniformis]